LIRNQKPYFENPGNQKFRGLKAGNREEDPPPWGAPDIFSVTRAIDWLAHLRPHLLTPHSASRGPWWIPYSSAAFPRYLNSSSLWPVIFTFYWVERAKATFTLFRILSFLYPPTLHPPQAGALASSFYSATIFFELIIIINFVTSTTSKICSSWNLMNSYLVFKFGCLKMQGTWHRAEFWIHN
jgi:hypothetical protein